MNTNRLIAASAVISFATIGAADLYGQQGQGGKLPSSREWIGLSIVFLMLSAASDLGIESAGGMAVLVMVTMLLSRGEQAAAYLGVRLNAGQPTQPHVSANPIFGIPRNRRKQALRNTRKQLGVGTSNRTKPTKPGTVTI